MLKCDTIGALLEGEGIADGVRFHISAKVGDNLLYYQQALVTGNRTRYRPNDIWPFLNECRLSRRFTLWLTHGYSHT